MPYQHIYNPVKGILTATPSVALSKEASPSMDGVYLYGGEVNSDSGVSNFPIASQVKTNQLHGIFMKGEQFIKSDGTTFPVALTTTNVYLYNTSTNTWDNITSGQTIDDCESAWTGTTNVTATNDTGTKLKGNKSVKLAINSSFATGVTGYRDISPIDLSNELGVHFWIYSSIALSAGDFQLLLDDTSACASPLESLDIPAITANTWTSVCINYNNPSLLTAVASVGLNRVVNKGAMNIFIDDIRSIVPFTGTASDQFSVATMNDYGFFTNGIDYPKQFYLDSPAIVTDAVTTLNMGAITSSDIVISFKDHLMYFNNIENGGSCFQRCSWSNIGSISDFINGTAGYQDITGDDDPIIAARIYMENRIVIYKSNSIIVCDWVGGQTPFRFTNMVRGYGAMSKESVMDYIGVQAVVGPSSIFKYAGWVTVEEIDKDNHQFMYNQINRAYISRIFTLYDKMTNELEFWFPTVTEYPDIVWVMETNNKAWFRKTRTMNGCMSYSTVATKTIGDLVGTIGDQNYRIGDNTNRSNTPIWLYGDANGKVYLKDKSTFNNNGAAITNEFQTPDFTNPQAKDIPVVGSMSNFFRIDQLVVEAKGQSITADFSTDGGASWSPCGGNNTQSLNSIYDFYQFDFDVVTRKIRFRFRNTFLSSGYTFRYYGFSFRPRSTRR